MDHGIGPDRASGRPQGLWIQGVGHDGPGPEIAVLGGGSCAPGQADDLMSMINQSPHERDADGAGGSRNDHSHVAPATITLMLPPSLSGGS